MRSEFIMKLNEILNNQDFIKIISWSKDGTSIIINNMQLLETEVLPQYFKHKNISSFKRQLNFYGFEYKKSYIKGQYIYYNSDFTQNLSIPKQINKILSKSNSNKIPINMKDLIQEHQSLMISVKHLSNKVTQMTQQIQKLSKLLIPFQLRIKIFIQNYQHFLVNAFKTGVTLLENIMKLLFSITEDILKIRIVELFEIAFSNQSQQQIQIYEFREQSINSPFFQFTPLPFNQQYYLQNNIPNKVEKKKQKLNQKILKLIDQSLDKVLMLKQIEY